MSLNVTEENFFELLAAYAEERYGSRLPYLYRNCPYNLDLHNGEFVYKQVLTWVMLQWINPETGRTVIDEFVERHVHDKELAARLLKVKEIVHDTFQVLNAKDKNGMIVARAESTGKTYQVYVIGSPELYVEGRYFSGIIHPFYDRGFWRTNGIITYKLTDEEMFERNRIITPSMAEMLVAQMEQEWQERVESIPIRQTSRIRPALKKFPSDWIDGMCKSLKIGTAGFKKKDRVEMVASVLTSRRVADIVSGLSEDEKAALRFISQRGGSVLYYDMQRRFGKDDTEWLWEGKKPKSIIGLLRRHGLVLVGTQRRGTRNYKVVAIARDVLEAMQSFRCL